MNGEFYDRIEKNYLGNTDYLFDGSLRIQDVIAGGVEKLIKTNKWFTFWGVDIDVLITSKERIIYPAPYIVPESRQAIGTKDFMKTARENYAIMNDGLELKVKVEVPHNSLLANSLLVMYLLIFGSGLYLYYFSATKKAASEALARDKEVERLRIAEADYRKRLVALEEERGHLSFKIEQIKSDLNDEKKRASLNEDEMIDEIVALEEKLEKNVEISTYQHREIESLQEKLSHYEKQAETKKRPKGEQHIQKRFKALYKNIDIDERAVNGFVDLTEDMRIKAEEIIHLLNDDAGQVIVKRKVFNRKSSLTFFEVRFAYKGRLYFHRKKDSRVCIVVIGTKNSQSKDLEYLDKL